MLAPLNLRRIRPFQDIRGLPEITNPMLKAISLKAMTTDPINCFLLTNLEARQKLCEMEYAVLIRLIESPDTPPFERGVAMERRDELMRDWARIVETLSLLAQDTKANALETRILRMRTCDPQKSRRN